ncbi:translation initiation factor IF-2 [Ornithorhynchus anatinus]|uniref:translation initiation factor IF-2 n=1 Tax=Ornithorhynchus anatinus TaxID=9258 RepID=UPI0010A7C4CE|nr:translation initiation factor IF-2 [Ornithorhynchus anatinus]
MSAISIHREHTPFGERGPGLLLILRFSARPPPCPAPAGPGLAGALPQLVTAPAGTLSRLVRYPGWYPIPPGALPLLVPCPSWHSAPAGPGPAGALPGLVPARLVPCPGWSRSGWCPAPADALPRLLPGPAGALPGRFSGRVLALAPLADPDPPRLPRRSASSQPPLTEGCNCTRGLKGTLSRGLCLGRALGPYLPPVQLPNREPCPHPDLQASGSLPCLVGESVPHPQRQKLQTDCVKEEGAVGLGDSFCWSGASQTDTSQGGQMPLIGTCGRMGNWVV